MNVRRRVARLVVGLAVLLVVGASAGRDGVIEWGDQGLVSARGLGRAGATVAESAQSVSARRAAIVDAQRRLLEIIEGVTLYGGVSTGDAMASNDVIHASVSGVLRGATVLQGSEAWDRDHRVYELVMVVPVGEVQRSLPRLRLAADGATILIVEQPPVSDPPDALDPSPPAASFAAADDHVQVDQFGSTTFDVLSNDVGDPSTFFVQVVAGVRHGTLIARGGGGFSYSHGGSGEPFDSFTYVLSDGTGLTSAATVEIRITSAPPDPAEETDVEPADAEAVVPGDAEAVVPGDAEAVVPGDAEAVVPADAEAVVPVGAQAPAPTVPDDAAGPTEDVSGVAVPAEDVSTEPGDEPAPPPAPPPEGVGGPAQPIPADMPALIVLDATGHSIDRPFALDISSTSGELIYELAIPNYTPSLDIARQQGAEVLTISAVGHDLVSVVLDEGQATRLRTLIAQRDYVASGDLWIAGGN